MGFFRQQEIKMAQRLLAWQYQRRQQPPPSEDELAKQAARLVDEAHTIARKRGRNVVAIMKEMVADIRKK